MKISYDPKTDSLFLELAKGKYVRSKKISDNVVVDFDKSGKVLGVEVLAAKENIPSFVPGKVKLEWNSSRIPFLQKRV